jgi:hypothetical protein
MVMSQYQNAGRSHYIKTDNKSFGRVELFEYLGAALMYQNSIQDEIESRLKLGNACCHSVHNFRSSSLLVVVDWWFSIVMFAWSVVLVVFA